MKSGSGGSSSSARQAPSNKPGRRERHRAEVRERLYGAALNLFLTRGLEETTIQDITEAADVGKGTFFNYFSSKEDILLTFNERQTELFERALTAVREGRKTAKQAIEDLCVEVSGWTPTLVYNVICAIGSRADVRQRYAQNLETRRQRMEQLVALGQEGGEVRTDRSAQEIAQAFQEFAWGTLLIWSLRGAGAFSARLRANFDLIFWGLAPGRRPSPTMKIAKG